MLFFFYFHNILMVDTKSQRSNLVHRHLLSDSHHPKLFVSDVLEDQIHQIHRVFVTMRERTGREMMCLWLPLSRSQIEEAASNICTFSLILRACQTPASSSVGFGVVWENQTFSLHNKYTWRRRRSVLSNHKNLAFGCTNSWCSDILKVCTY